MSFVESPHWTFILATPAGDVRSTYQLSADALEFDSDSLWDGGHVSLPWSAILEAGTATLDMPAGRGTPDLGRFVPAELEWLIASRSDASTKPFMRPLPPPPDRDALIASVRHRLGTRWAGERIPFADAQKRFGMPSGGENLKAAGIVVGVLALLALLIILLALLLSPIVLFPAGFALGAWLVRAGLSGLRSVTSVANTPTAQVGSAAGGLIELHGVAKTAHPSIAAVTGRPSVWWDVAVEVWSLDGDKTSGAWHQLAARHGGTMDALEVEHQSGRVRVWLKDADLLLAEDSWEAGKDALPSTGAAFIGGLGFAWQGRLRLRETRLEVDAPVYVLGTLDERRTLTAGVEGGIVDRIATLLRTGQWRKSLIQVLPRWLGQVIATLFGFLSIVLGVGRGGERVKGPQHSLPPDMSPDALLVWKGDAGRPFIVSNRDKTQALSQLRSRSLYRCAAGIGVLCYCVYQLFQAL